MISEVSHNVLLVLNRIINFNYRTRTTPISVGIEQPSKMSTTIIRELAALDDTISIVFLFIPVWVTKIPNFPAALRTASFSTLYLRGVTKFRKSWRR